MAQSYNSLANCIQSLSASVSLLDNSLRTIDDSTRDVNRLRKVLRTNKVFGLVPELDLENAKRSVVNEVRPQIKVIIQKIDRELLRLRRRKTNLTGKVDLQQVRLENASKTNRDSLGSVRGGNEGVLLKGDVNEAKIARLRLLQNKKERLKYSLSRLNLQDKKARLSMIPSLPPDSNKE